MSKPLDNFLCTQQYVPNMECSAQNPLSVSSAQIKTVLFPLHDANSACRKPLEHNSSDKKRPFSFAVFKLKSEAVSTTDNLRTSL